MSPLATTRDYLIHPFTDLADHETRGSLVINRGRGIFVYDHEGKEYIEGISGLWCASLGFSDEELIDAALEQLRLLPAYHVAAYRTNEPAIVLADKLRAVGPGRCARVFLSNSGSEANETQIKLLWYYNNALGRPGKKKIVSQARAYHGSSIGAGSLTGIPSVHRGFDLPAIPVLFAECPDFTGKEGQTEEDFVARLAADLEALIQREDPETIAAFIAEPVLSAGGVVVPPSGYFTAIGKVLRKYDIRLIDDEVICGFGRTGEMWGAQTLAMTPQSVTCGKGLSAGYMPVAAVLIDDDLYAAMLEQSRLLGGFAHGFTYGGHPVAAAVACRVLEILERRKIIDHVRVIAPRFSARLRALEGHPLVRNARSVGLLGAITLDWGIEAAAGPSVPGRLAAECVARCQDQGVLLRALGDTVAFCPPLIITEGEIDELFRRFGLALADVENWAAHNRPGA